MWAVWTLGDSEPFLNTRLIPLSHTIMRLFYLYIEKGWRTLRLAEKRSYKKQQQKKGVFQLPFYFIIRHLYSVMTRFISRFS